ncbi:MAG: pyridoxal-dependent decarboxylase [Acidimicrobiia bacterium]
MTPDEFRRRGKEVIDWIADYMERVEEYPVQSKVKPGDVRAQLPGHPPKTGEPFHQVLADLDHIVMPGITHWQSPGFFAFFNANASGPAILGDLVSSGLGVQGMLWATSPACTELETHVMDWLVEMLELPPAFLSSGMGGGVIQDSASSATLTAIIAAREAATTGAVNRTGSLGNLVAYTSTQAHSSIEKGIRIAGIGINNLRTIQVDAAFAMEPAKLELAIQEDLAEGRLPFFVCATIGTTSSTAIDPVREIGEVCRRHGLWLHVDAALAGTAALLPEMRWIHDGIELADSYVFNPHKWMLTNFDCTAFFVADRAALIGALSVLPEYLRNDASASGAVIDYRDWQIPLGRRFRALKLWFVIRHYGVDGLRAFVGEHLRLARLFASWIDADDDFELAAPVPVNLVCFRHMGGDNINQRIMDRVNQSGEIYLTHTRLNGELTLRMSIGQTHTEERHVRNAWALIRTASR